MIYLRQSTASQEVLIGPFLDDTDGKTAETGLTIANTDIKVWKHGGTTEASKTSGGATHIASGRYYAVLDATDTDTIGGLELNVHVSGALPCKVRCCVLDEAVYDVLFGTTAPSTYAGADTSGTTTLLSRIGSAITITSGRVNADVTHLLGTAWLTPGTAGTPDVNVRLISGDSTAADNAESFFDGTGYAGTNNVIPLVTLTTTATTLTNLPAITAGWLTATGIAADAITAAKVAADVGTEIANATLTALGTGTWLTAVPWNAAWDAEVQSECADALTAYGAATEAGLITLGSGIVSGGPINSNVLNALLIDYGNQSLACGLAGGVGGDVAGKVLGGGAGAITGTGAWALGPAGATLATPTNITAGTITTATNVTTVNGLAANVITAASIATDAGAEIATALLDLADGVETSVTVRKALRAMAAVLAGNVADAGTAAELFKAIGNSGTTRVTNAGDEDGNRAITLNL